MESGSKGYNWLPLVSFQRGFDASTQSTGGGGAVSGSSEGVPEGDSDGNAVGDGVASQSISGTQGMTNS